LETSLSSQSLALVLTT